MIWLWPSYREGRLKWPPGSWHTPPSAEYDDNFSHRQLIGLIRNKYIVEIMGSSLFCVGIAGVQILRDANPAIPNEPDGHFSCGFLDPCLRYHFKIS